MSERYTKLFTLPSRLYAEDSPVIIEAGALTKDNDTDRVFAQLRFHNISDRLIKALSVSLDTYFVSGEKTGEPVKYQYLDIRCGINEDFGGKTPVMLAVNTARSFSVHVDKVVYADGSVDEINLDFKESLPSQSLLVLQPGWSKATVDELGKMTNEQCVYSMMEYKDLWICSCGGVNKLGRDSVCRRCSVKRDTLLSITPEVADEHRKDAIYQKAIAQMKTESIYMLESVVATLTTISEWKDTAEKIAECKEKIEKLKAEEAETKREQAEIAKKQKKKMTIVGVSVLAAACACVAVILLVTQVIIPNENYNNAVALMEAGSYDEAISAFTELGDYKDSADKIDACGSAKYGEETWNKIKNINVGYTYTFGSYEQDNNTSNGKEEIEWQILEKQDNKILLISKYALDCQQYNTEQTDVTWETCTLRSWLNSTFINNAFTEAEQSMIADTKVTADKNPNYSTNPGNDTTDKIFLLSINEVNKYFTTDESRKCVPTAYAIEQGAYTSDSYTTGGKATCWWWLRSPGSSQDFASLVYFGGSVSNFGYYVDGSSGCVRPALWINL